MTTILYRGEHVTTMTTAHFRADPISGYSPLSVTFTDSSIGHPLSWSWDFGDGAASMEQNPTHLYTHPGIYHPTLIVTDEYGSSEFRAGSPIYVQSEFAPVQDPWYKFPIVLIGVGLAGYVLYRALVQPR